MKIAQIGTFDVENFGDLLFTNILDYWVNDKGKIDLFSPKGGIKCFGSEIVFPISYFEEKCKKNKYDLVVIGGGDLIRLDNDITITNNYYEHNITSSLDLWAIPILIANKYNIPIVLNAVGVTNDFSSDEIPIVKYLLSMVSYISVRDLESFNALKIIGVDNVKIVPDTVLSINKIYDSKKLIEQFEILKNNQIVPQLDNYIIFQHNSRFIDDIEYYEKIVGFLKSASKHYNILLMPIGYIHDDDKVLNKIYNEKIDNVFMVDKNYKLSPFEMISIIYNSYGYVGTSMHGAVVSHSYKKPILILNTMNSKKLHGFAKISDNYDVDVNDINNLEYVFFNRFGKKSVNNIDNLIEKIGSHFNEILDIKKIKNDVNSRDCLLTYFNTINNKNEIYGYYYFDDNILDRIIFKWNYDSEKNEYFYSFSCCKNLKICISSINDYIIEECNLNIFNSIKKYCNSDKYIYIKNTIIDIFDADEKVNIVFKLSNFSSEKLLDVIDEIENTNNDKIDKILIDYKNLEKKYCNEDNE